MSDPNALDAPQTITVTVSIGGGVPSQVDLTVPPNGTASTPFSSNSNLILKTTTSSGGNWLTVPLEDGGTFRYVYNYTVVTKPGALADGTYTGQIAVTGSALPEENHAVPVNMHVTSQPIAQTTSDHLNFKVVQGSQGDLTYLQVYNRGLGTFTVNSATAVTTSGGDWLKLSYPNPAVNSYVQVTANTATLAPGTYAGEVHFSTNAVNPDVTVPVNLEVVALGSGAPTTFYQGAVNNATYLATTDLAPGSIVSLFGELLTSNLPAKFAAAPLPTTLDTTRVLVNGSYVPLYYAGNGQVNFQLPFETPVGSIQVQAERDGIAGNKITALVSARAPQVLPLGIGEYGIITYADGRTYPIPAGLGVPAHPAKPGDVLIFWMIDFGATSPPVATGDASPGAPFARVPGDTYVYFGGSTLAEGVPSKAQFAGLTPTFVGLYQVNVAVPAGAPKGNNVVVQVGNGGVRSNKVQIAIQ